MSKIVSSGTNSQKMNTPQGDCRNRKIFNDFYESGIQHCTQCILLERTCSMKTKETEIIYNPAWARQSFGTLQLQHRYNFTRHEVNPERSIKLIILKDGIISKLFEMYIRRKMGFIK